MFKIPTKFTVNKPNSSLVDSNMAGPKILPSKAKNKTGISGLIISIIKKNTAIRIPIERATGFFSKPNIVQREIPNIIAIVIAIVINATLFEYKNTILTR